MITPDGVECRYYYADYFRGQDRQECRLIDQNPSSEAWRPQDCTGCQVPGILQANACPNLVLEGRVEKRFLGFSRRITATAVCSKYLVAVPEPKVGCGHCHEERPGAALFNPTRR